MIIRYQMGPFGALSYRSLRISLELMRRLVPDAEFHVTYQILPENRPPVEELRGVTYHWQNPNRYPYGRHEPPRFNPDVHEVWLDNDHFMWELPPGWVKFCESKSAVLIWRTDWDYYGCRSGEVWDAAGSTSFNASAGMWGIPPNFPWKVPELRSSPASKNQEEMGWVVARLARHDEHEYIWESHEVTAYNPAHPVLGRSKRKIGRYGIHLMGMNRGFNPHAERMLNWIESVKLNGDSNPVPEPAQLIE